MARAEAVRARSDNRTWAIERRARTRQLIELGGLVQKAGLVDLTDDDRAALLGAFLELADPLIPAAIHQATAAGATKVLVLPYFLYPGRHLSLDIPELVATTAAMHPDVEIITMPGFGEDPAVLGLLVAQVRRANAR